MLWVLPRFALLALLLAVPSSPVRAQEVPSEACFACVEGLGCAQTPFTDFGKTRCRRRCEQVCGPSGCIDICFCITEGDNCSFRDIPHEPGPGGAPSGATEDPEQVRAELEAAMREIQKRGDLRLSQPVRSRVEDLDPILAVLLTATTPAAGPVEGWVHVTTVPRLQAETKPEASREILQALRFSGTVEPYEGGARIQLDVVGHPRFRHLEAEVSGPGDDLDLALRTLTGELVEHRFSE